jgi:hypothetical protein
MAAAAPRCRLGDVVGHINGAGEFDFARMILVRCKAGIVGRIGVKP